MKNSDFYDFGEQIQKIVQSAIDSNDFRELNATVRQTVNDAVGAVRSVFLRHRRACQRRRVNMERKIKARLPGPQVHRGEVRSQSSYKQRDKEQAKYFASHPKGEIGGTLMVVIGFILSTMFGIGLAVLLIVQFVLDGLTALFIPIFILLLLFIIFMILGMRGHRITSRIKRFREYRKILDDREFCDVEELAQKLGKTPAYVVKDLKEMMKRRMFYRDIWINRIMFYDNRPGLQSVLSGSEES